VVTRLPATGPLVFVNRTVTPGAPNRSFYTGRNTAGAGTRSGVSQVVQSLAVPSKAGVTVIIVTE
jgi:hypothetical protein